jgi:predicted acyltransferase
MSNQEKLKKLHSLESLVNLMDSKFSFMGFSFGLDAIIGLIPGLGDIAGGLISILIIIRIRHIGVSEVILSKMIRNVLVDVFVGTVPIFGDLFDIGFKVNDRNLQLAKDYLQ